MSASVYDFVYISINPVNEIYYAFIEMVDRNPGDKLRRRDTTRKSDSN